MISLIKKGYNVIQNDGLLVFSIRIVKYTALKVKRLFIHTDFGDWESLKGKYQGKRIFILGNGPSLNETELYFLKDEYTLCFNRVNLMLERLNWKPDFYVMTDDLLIKDMANEVNNEILPNVGLGFFPDIHPSNVSFKRRIGEKENVLYLNTDSPEFSTDLPKCGINKTVVNPGLQIAAYMGFTEIYLLGVDMTFADQKVIKKNSRNWTAEEDDDPNHFDPRYFGTGRSYHNPTVHEMIEQFGIGKDFLNDLGIKTYNAGRGGKLEVFPRIAFESLFEFSEQQKEQLFLDLVSLDDQSKSVEELFKKYPNIQEASDFNDGLDTFIIEVEKIHDLVNVAVFSHIPYGPIHGKYIFKKRNSNQETPIENKETKIKHLQ